PILAGGRSREARSKEREAAGRHPAARKYWAPRGMLVLLLRGSDRVLGAGGRAVDRGYRGVEIPRKRVLNGIGRALNGTALFGVPVQGPFPPVPSPFP